MSTMDQLISDTLTRLSMASGVGSQVYSEDRIALAINEAFISCFEVRFWRRYSTQETFTLDGTTGIVTADLTARIRDFNDIQYVWKSDYQKPLPIVPANMPQSMVRRLSITNTNSAKMFKVLPVTTTGDVVVKYRTRPAADYSGEDEVPMDRFLLMYKACYDILVDEGTNDTGVQKFLELYNQRRDMLVSMEDQHEISLGDYANTTGPNEWQELP